MAAGLFRCDPHELTWSAGEGLWIEAYPTEQLRFDLAPIRQRFRAAYGHDSGTDQLRLHPAPDTDRPLVYQF